MHAFVVDLDVRVDEDTGEAFTIEGLLACLAQELGAPLPEPTVTSVTPSGGRHVFVDPRMMDWPKKPSRQGSTA